MSVVLTLVNLHKAVKDGSASSQSSLYPDSARNGNAL